MLSFSNLTTSSFEHDISRTPEGNFFKFIANAYSDLKMKWPKKKKKKKREHYDIWYQKRSEVKCTVAIVWHHSSLDWSTGAHDRHAIVLVLRIMSTNILALFPVNLFIIIPLMGEVHVGKCDTRPFTSELLHIPDRKRKRDRGWHEMQIYWLWLSFFLVSLLPVNRDVTIRSCQWEAFVSMRGLKSS